MIAGMQAEKGKSVGAGSIAAEFHVKPLLQQLIQGRREYLRLSQEDVAARLEMSPRAYGNWERGVVKEWTDQKLNALADALEMTEFQMARLFWIAVGRSPQPDLRRGGKEARGEEAATAAFLRDYTVMMDALSLPTFLIDHRWNVTVANDAYRALFQGVRQHPTAMPCTNFLRFGLFHPDASVIFVNHLNWQLSMLAQLASSLERHDQDASLRAIRRDVYLHPVLRDAYLNDMPTWILGAGTDLVHHQGRVRALRHPQVGLQGCRLVEETHRPLQAHGLTRITLVLTESGGRSTAESGRGHDHHAA